MAIAILDSVTVSIADEINGICKFKLLCKVIFVIVSLGTTEDS